MSKSLSTSRPGCLCLVGEDLPNFELIDVTECCLTKPVGLTTLFIEEMELTVLVLFLPVFLLTTLVKALNASESSSESESADSSVRSVSEFDVRSCSETLVNDLFNCGINGDGVYAVAGLDADCVTGNWYLPLYEEAEETGGTTCWIIVGEERSCFCSVLFLNEDSSSCKEGFNAVSGTFSMVLPLEDDLNNLATLEAAGFLFWSKSGLAN
ncbi:hypothetical protein WICPIJ_005097 [Wickerhamomyces pijperi]|uniref:Uncharacterized protein n=1 Tax=Wickerhamomyces pijperi TaxID=599730 RepID=A0A9P8Q449_WICPI|nr:hypothetical protein WICPIJ_005097 [Wickerhamomyces pijperi]